jgi:hypothetical protein
MKNVLMVLCLALLSFGCDVSESTAQEVLADEGYHDIHLTGHSWWGCSDEDSFASTFTAKRWVTNEDGDRVERTIEGSICCGYWKDCTVRH